MAVWPFLPPNPTIHSGSDYHTSDTATEVSTVDLSITLSVLCAVSNLLAKPLENNPQGNVPYRLVLHLSLDPICTRAVHIQQAHSCLATSYAQATNLAAGRRAA